MDRPKSLEPSPQPSVQYDARATSCPAESRESPDPNASALIDNPINEIRSGVGIAPEVIVSTSERNDTWHPAPEPEASVAIKREESLTLLIPAGIGDTYSAKRDDQVEPLQELPQASFTSIKAKSKAPDAEDETESRLERLVDQLGGRAAMEKQFRHLIVLQHTNQLTEEEAEKLMALEDLTEALKNIRKKKARVKKPAEFAEPADMAISGESDVSSDEGSIYQGDGALSAGAVKSGKKGQNRTRNAREYVAKLEAREKKRRAIAKQQGSNKGRKLNNGRRKFTGDVSELRKLVDGLKDVGANLADAGIHAAPPIVATTKADQFSQLRRSIPEGCDLRRSSTQQRDLDEASRLFGYGNVKAVDGRWLLNGMQTPLMGHQLPASAWMVERELRKGNPNGGILADVMGMGKTLISIGCIIGNPPDAKALKTFSLATLVIVPNQSVGGQWQQELITHGNSELDPFQYSDRDLRRIQHIAARSRVVIATYGQVSRQYPRKGKLRELQQKYGSDEFSYKKELHSLSGPLFQVGWYRVILDEAHAIKNADSQVARACCALGKNYAWALSGTPIANSIDELYPYMKFIGVSSTKDLPSFKSKFVRDQNKASANLAALVCLVMYRRTRKDTFLGRQILDLPESHTLDLWVPISTEEDLIHQMIDSRWKEIIDELEENDGKEGSTKRQRVLACKARCLKLRQAVSHGFTLESVFREKLDITHLQELKNELLKIEKRETIIEQIRKEHFGSGGISKFESGLNKVQSLGLGGVFDWDALLQLIVNETEVRTSRCLLCKQDDMPERPMRSKNCQHIYCWPCLSQLIVTAAMEVEEGKNLPLFECRHEDCSMKLSIGEHVKTLKGVEDAAAKDKAFKEPGMDSNGVRIQRSRGSNGCFAACGYDAKIGFPPSTKVTAALAVMFTWMEEAPDDKILIFTEFLMTGKVLGRMLEHANVPFIYYFGETTQMQKNKALEEFKHNPDKKVMLVSLRSGGQSLNLTVANRVISIDPWWNTTVEQQAFGRVVRMGQTKPSYWVKIMVNGSIDEKIATVQRNKSETVDRALQDDGHVPEALDDECMLKLFTPEPEPPVKAKKCKNIKSRKKQGSRIQ